MDKPKCPIGNRAPLTDLQMFVEAVMFTIEINSGKLPKDKTKMSNRARLIDLQMLVEEVEVCSFHYQNLPFLFVAMEFFILSL